MAARSWLPGCSTSNSFALIWSVTTGYFQIAATKLDLYRRMVFIHFVRFWLVDVTFFGAYPVFNVIDLWFVLLETRRRDVRTAASTVRGATRPRASAPNCCRRTSTTSRAGATTPTRPTSSSSAGWSPPAAGSTARRRSWPPTGRRRSSTRRVTSSSTRSASPTSSTRRRSSISRSIPSTDPASLSIDPLIKISVIRTGKPFGGVMSSA